ncbi:hypothetical protein HYV49_01115 [Candidatus Pacearchaeota archaeon]|nr:hypothetical protein [Candidatus Pacearchaeota archaeon]
MKKDNDDTLQIIYFTKNELTSVGHKIETDTGTHEFHFGKSLLNMIRLKGFDPERFIDRKGGFVVLHKISEDKWYISEQERE